nr:SMI1/KNR4 family protein [Anatilimnocola floriformis]
MCRNNGGQITVGSDYWFLHPIFDDSDRARLKRTCNDIVRETAAARDRPDFPAAALTIGNNGCGDELILLPDDDSGRYAEVVYWWDHETGELEKVADAFDELTQ